MATRVPQRQLRNETAALLRRVEAGERLQVTVHGHPVAELGPLGPGASFVPRERLVAELGGLLDRGDDLGRELREAEGEGAALDPFA